MQDDLLVHEVLDRSQVAAESFNHFIRDHEVVRDDKELSDLADRVLSCIADFGKAVFERY
jgi:hypothetical protein